MGPRRWGRGRLGLSLPATAEDQTLQWGHDAGVVEDVGCFVATQPRIRGFNGATTLGSWKTPGRARHAGILRGGFNGATTLGSWKTRHDRVIEADVQGFNGATTLGSWKTPAVRGLGDSFGHASMGPRRWGRGRRDTGWSVPINSNGFNGATTLGSWKTLRPAIARSGTVPASMGPRRWGRGRLVSAMILLTAYYLLQWGHDAGVVEDRRACQVQLWLTRTLQWGHDAGVVEDLRKEGMSEGYIRASMGPRRWGRGRPPKRTCSCKRP